jgi:RNA polymerase-binding transcription factor DksA
VSDEPPPGTPTATGAGAAAEAGAAAGTGAAGSAADVAAERAGELAALGQVRSDLDDVDRALARLDAGTYGTCEVCGAALPDEELAARPAARLCAEHGPPVADPS